jgi:hypothetical protein
VDLGPDDDPLEADILDCLSGQRVIDPDQRDARLPRTNPEVGSKGPLDDHGAEATFLGLSASRNAPWRTKQIDRLNTQRRRELVERDHCRVATPNFERADVLLT